jgi:hypothetical protein
MYIIWYCNPEHYYPTFHYLENYYLIIRNPVRDVILYFVTSNITFQTGSYMTVRNIERYAGSIY